MRRVGARRQVRVAAVSDSKLRHGGTVLAAVQHDAGLWSAEGLYSSDVALLGARALCNCRDSPGAAPGGDKAVGRLSAGAELYYGVLNKSAGVSAGLRYATLPSHPGTPLTMTLTLNPLMGHLTATYVVRAGANAAFASRFEFNMFSYESDLVVGAELWRKECEGEGVLVDFRRREGVIWRILHNGRF